MKLSNQTGMRDNFSRGMRDNPNCASVTQASPCQFEDSSNLNQRRHFVTVKKFMQISLHGAYGNQTATLMCGIRIF